MAGHVGPVLREDVEHADIAAAAYLEHAYLARSLARAPQCFAELRSRRFRDVSKFGGLLLRQEYVLFLLHKMRAWY